MDLSESVQEQLVREAQLYFPYEHAWCVNGERVDDAIMFYADESKAWFLCLGGKEVHSHPADLPVPSKTDIVSYKSRLFGPNDFYIVGLDPFDRNDWKIVRWGLK